MKKLLIWDCDETLWSGTIMDGEEPSINTFTRNMVEVLSSRGVVQSIASRNLIEDIYEYLGVLDISDYFLVPQADLTTPKSKMIHTIKEELGLARFEDIVFVDDQLFNRAEVEIACPGITVCDPSEMPEIISKYFTKEHYTDDDKKRVQRYRSEIERKRGASSYEGDYMSFLRASQMEMYIFHPDEDELPRFKDLLARANRMSALDGNFTNEAIDKIHRDTPECLIACRVSDKFGDYGLCGIAILDKTEVDTFVRGIVISCRLQGKGVGSALLGMIMNIHVGRVVHGIWARTKYNEGMKNLYEWYDFNQKNIEGEKYHFFKHINKEESLPPWISIIYEES
tara:strand:+ start:102 stop:1121 length:1020 start_codon:yes stop_codon:yes gene_type:complete